MSLIKQQLLLQQQQQLQHQQLAAQRNNRASITLSKRSIPRSPFYATTSTKRYDLMTVGDPKDETFVILEEPIDPDVSIPDINSELSDIAFLVNQMVYYVSYQYAQEITREEMEGLEQLEQECWLLEFERLESMFCGTQLTSAPQKTKRKAKGLKPKTSKKVVVDDDNLPPLFYDPILNAPSDVLLKKSKESSVQFSYSIPIFGGSSGTSSSGMLNKRLSEIANMLADTIKKEKREKK